VQQGIENVGADGGRVSKPRATARYLLSWLWFLPALVSLRNGEIAGDDPWEANTLEWATSSPPPPYNFDHLPEVRSERPVFDARHGRTAAH